MAEATAFDYKALAPRVRRALRYAFPRDFLIETRQGYLGRVHALIVSKRPNGMSERDKQALVWDALRAHLGEDTKGVSLAVAYGTDEL